MQILLHQQRPELRKKPASTYVYEHDLPGTQYLTIMIRDMLQENESKTFIPRSVYDADPWKENTWNLSGVCLSYPDSTVCDIPEVISTLK